MPGPLRGADQLGEGQRHQLWELPPLKTHVTEYRFYTYECSLCQTPTTPEWPCQVPQGQFGPQLVATLALLHGQYQLSLRQLQALAVDLWQLPLSLGGIADACKKTTQALQTPYHQVEQQVQSAPTLHVDETGWYRAGKLKWLWVAEAPHSTLFKISAGRGHSQLDTLSGSDYGGLLHSDRLRTYLKVDPKRHQLCWAHLIRNLRGLAERGGAAQSWGETMLILSGRLFEVWQRYRLAEGALDREWLAEAVQPIRAEFKAGLERGLNLPDGKVKAFCRELVGLEERLYLFVKEAGVEPTNNAAERALRGAVIWRKKCYGNQSRWGEEFVERLLSIGFILQQTLLLGDPVNGYTIHLYHCKYSHKAEPGSRLEDLYEVCGQAQKCERWMRKPANLFERLGSRERKKGPTRFEKGGAAELLNAKRLASIYDVKFNVYIVQPGVSKNSISDQQKILLSVTENYLLETYGAKFHVIVNK